MLLLVAAARIAAGRDVGRGLLAGHDSAPPRLRLLSSPTALALRTLRGGVLGWLSGIAVFALLMGVISDSVASGLSQSLEDQLQKLGDGCQHGRRAISASRSCSSCWPSASSPASSSAAIRDEETEQRLETLLALPVRRGRWFIERWR